MTYVISWRNVAGVFETITRNSWIDACAVMKLALENGGTDITLNYGTVTK